MFYSNFALSDEYLVIGISSFFGIIIGLILRSLKKSKNLIKKDANNFQRYPRKFRGVVENVSYLKSISSKSTQSLFDPAKYKLSIIIPAFNEEKRLENMLKDAVKVLRSKIDSTTEYNCEVILVDDGSKDNTVTEYKRIIKQYGYNMIPNLDFKLISLVVNSGKGRAVSEGILASLGENILFADADGSTEFDSVNKFEKIVNNGKGDVLICGSRCHMQNDSDAVVQRSIFRLFLMKCFHLYLNFFGVKSVSDTQCGFKMMNRSAAQKIIPWIHISGWIFDVEMILLAERKSIKIHEVPVNWREMNGTKLRLAVDSIKMAKDLLRIRLNYLLGVWKCEK